MPIVYKVDVLQALKEAGYSTYRLRKDKLLGEATIQRLRDRESVSWEVLSALCELLKCPLCDIVEYMPNEKRDAGETV